MKPSKEDQLIRVSEAERLLSNPLLMESVLSVRSNIYNTIENSKWFQGRMREAAYTQLKGLNSVISVLEREIQTGKLARSQLKRENKYI